MGVSIYKNMDALADAIVQKDLRNKFFSGSSMTTLCATCHHLYRFGVNQ